MLESGKATDREPVKKGRLMNPQAVTRRDLPPDLTPVLTEIRRQMSFFGLFPHRVKIDLPANKDRLVSFVNTALNKIRGKLHSVQIPQKNHVRSPSDLKIVSRYRPAVNLITRVHSRPVAFYQLGPANRIGVYAPYRQSIGGRRLLVRKDALATRTNGPSWKKIRDDSRRLKRELARFFHSMWRRDHYALRNR